MAGNALAGPLSRRAALAVDQAAQYRCQGR